MIVNWNKFERRKQRPNSINSNKTNYGNQSNKSSHSNSQSCGKDFQYTSDPFISDLFQDKNTSFTSANSLANNGIETKDKDGFNKCFLAEIDMSEINGNKDVNEGNDFFLSHINSSINLFDWQSNQLCRSDQIQPQSQSQSQPQSQPQPQSRMELNSNDVMNKNFLQLISNKKAFSFLLGLLDQNPSYFLQTYFSIMISNFQDIILNNMSSIIFIKVFPYFTKYHKEIFFNKIFKTFFNLLSHNQYGVEVLNQFIVWIINDNDSLTVNVIEIIKANLVELATDEYGFMIILSLLNQRNPLISKIMYDLIVSNILLIALNSNGVKVIIHLMAFSNCTQRLIEAIMKNLNRLIIHSQGHILVIYLLAFQNNYLSSFIVNYLCANITFFACSENGGKVIEECFSHCDEVVLFPLINLLCYKEVLSKLCLNKMGLRVLMKAVDHSQQPTKSFLLNQIASETKKE